MTSPSIVWLRDDLRLVDNPALNAAVERSGPVVVLWLLDEQSQGARPLGGYEEPAEVVRVYADPAGHPFCLFVRR